jgi:hypothetical protein
MSDTGLDVKFKRLGWREARKVIANSPAKDRAAPFLNAVDAVARHLRSEAVVYHASYPFGAHIVDEEGFRVPSSDTDGNPVIGLSADVPVNLLIRNQAEVYLPHTYNLESREGYRHGVPIDRPQTLRVLSPGELFGTFEVVNRFLKRKGGQSSWQVSAGCRSVQLICPIKSNLAQRQLRARLQDSFPRVEGPVHEWPWHLLVALGATIPWQVETIVFPIQWEAHSLPWDWRQEVFGAAWAQMQDDKVNEIRRGDLSTSLTKEKELQPFSREVADGSSAISFLLTMDAVSSGRIPAFVASHTQTVGSEAGPFDSIVKELIVTLGTNCLKRSTSKGFPPEPIIMVPKYLSKAGETGFISFKRGARIAGADAIERNPSGPLGRLGKAITHCQAALKLVVPTVEWEHLQLVVPSGTSLVEPLCLKASDLNTHANLVPPPREAPEAEKDEKQPPCRVDGSHPFFAACAIVRRK